jgi:hypothetical protein
MPQTICLLEFIFCRKKCVIATQITSYNSTMNIRQRKPAEDTSRLPMLLEIGNDIRTTGANA